MKYKIYKMVISAGVFVVCLNSCKKMTDGYSTDPMNITDPSVISNSRYLSGIEMSLIACYEADIAQYTGIWSNYFSGELLQYLGFQNYVISADYMNNTWQLIYNNVLKNHFILEEKAIAGRDFSLLAISQVNAALALGLAADLWGDVPYSEAGKYPAILNPKFDPQSSVYAAVQTLLDNALANFNKNSGTTTGDFLLAGNKNTWIKVIHSAKARYYLHIKDYQKAIVEGLSGISTAGENLMAPHGNTNLKNINLYYSLLAYERVGCMSANSYAPTLLDSRCTDNYKGNAKTDESARLWWYYTIGGLKNRMNDEYEINYASPDAAVGAAYTGFFGSNSSFPLITFEETLLILAEAYMKQAVPDPVNALLQLNLLRKYYNTGAPFLNSTFLKKTFKYQEYAASDFSAGGIANTKGEDSNAALLREILKERYVSFIGQIEGWTDMRRTRNYLGLPLADGKTDFPRRLLYPQIEVNTNTNTPVGVELYDDVPSFSTPY